MNNDTNNVYDENFNVDVAVPFSALYQLCGISRATAERRKQEGVFVSSVSVGQSHKALYPLRENLQRFREAESDKALRASLSAEVADLKAEKLKAEIALKRSQGELHQLKTAHTQGEYLRRDDVVNDLEMFFVQLRKFLQAVPPRVGGIVAGYVDPVIERHIEKDIQKDINEMLRAFCDASESFKR